jgi:hypothetical protein
MSERLTIHRVQEFIGECQRGIWVNMPEALLLAERLLASMQREERFRSTLKNCADLMAERGMCNEAYEIDVLLRETAINQDHRYE